MRQWRKSNRAIVAVEYRENGLHKRLSRIVLNKLTQSYSLLYFIGSIKTVGLVARSSLADYSVRNSKQHTNTAQICIQCMVGDNRLSCIICGV